VPLQGMYSASKHAVKGFTGRVASRNSTNRRSARGDYAHSTHSDEHPIPQHARNYMDKEPKLPSPLDDPEDVAKAILDAAVKTTRTKRSATCRR
jgi:hypothetical protein